MVRPDQREKIGIGLLADVSGRALEARQARAWRRHFSRLMHRNPMSPRAPFSDSDARVDAESSPAVQEIDPPRSALQLPGSSSS
ncbi:MAG: hypothetical protein KAY24_11405, partial [Candidatus Eisenbacteria sp.]|nr:hypothetical protein [Candidatus Eisenbacteria bacterium]